MKELMKGSIQIGGNYILKGSVYDDDGLVGDAIITIEQEEEPLFKKRSSFRSLPRVSIKCKKCGGEAFYYVKRLYRCQECDLIQKG